MSDVSLKDNSLPWKHERERGGGWEGGLRKISLNIIL